MTFLDYDNTKKAVEGLFQLPETRMGEGEAIPACRGGGGDGGSGGEDGGGECDQALQGGREEGRRSQDHGRGWM